MTADARGQRRTADNESQALWEASIPQGAKPEATSGPSGESIRRSGGHAEVVALHSTDEVGILVPRGPGRGKGVSLF